MPRALNRLPPKAALTVSKPGRHADGGGLYLVVSPAGTKKWVFRFRWRSKLSDMGLGSASVVSLAKARERAADARRLLSENINPIEAKRATAGTPTFGEAADAYVRSQSPQWRNPKHRAQWQATLTREAAVLRPLKVDEIHTAHVLQVLKPIWTKKAETAARLRGRIERVLDAAKAQGFRSGENPARWRGHLDHLLPKRHKLTRGHHAALDFMAVPDFIKELRQRDAVASLALEFTILTAARSGEVRGAKWAEVDLVGEVWTVPAARTKAGREHRVPLSGAAVSVLQRARLLSNGAPDEYLFPGNKIGGPLSDAAFSALLKRMGKGSGAITPHGFRSSFRDWAGEATNFPRELAELSLAHVVGDATERAYRRGDALARRRELMDAWARHCEGRATTPVRLVETTS